MCESECMCVHVQHLLQTSTLDVVPFQLSLNVNVKCLNLISSHYSSTAHNTPHRHAISNHIMSTQPHTHMHAYKVNVGGCGHFEYFGISQLNGAKLLNKNDIAANYVHYVFY